MGSTEMVSSKIGLELEAPHTDVKGLVSRQVEIARQSTALICNVGDEQWIIARQYGNYIITPKKAGERYSTLVVHGATAPIDLGDKRTITEPVWPDDIAKDIVSGNDLEKFGVFVPASASGPSIAEIEAAEKAHVEYMNHLVGVADAEWTATHRVTFIPDVAKRAVERLGLEREWAYKPTSLVDCPVCGERIKPKVAICKHCHAILNRETAAQYGLEPQPENESPMNLVEVNAEEVPTNARATRKSRAAAAKS